MVLGGGLLLAAEVREAASLVELAELRGSMAGRGGGVVFVRNAEDCSATAGAVELAAAALQKQGMVVQGVILRRGPVDVAVQLAGEAFPHRTLSPGATAAMSALGHVQTPLALVINASGAVVKMEPTTGREWEAIVRSLGPT